VGKFQNIGMLKMKFKILFTLIHISYISVSNFENFGRPEAWRFLPFSAP